MKFLIVLSLIFPVLTVNTQVIENNKFSIQEWFKSDNEGIKIGYENNSPEDYYGVFNVIGWSEDGLIAYTYQTSVSIVCEIELEFHIYDLVKNKHVSKAFMCKNIDWFDMKDSTIQRVLNELEKHDIKPAKNQKLLPINTKIEKTDSLINVYHINSNKNELLTTLKISDGYYNILESDGCLISPYDNQLKALLFGDDKIDLGQVLIFGTK